VPNREEDGDCHQCHNGHFPTVAGHRDFPPKGVARRVATIERTLLDLVFDGSANLVAARRRSQKKLSGNRPTERYDLGGNASAAGRSSSDDYGR
jgi:hypothetical protein